MSETTNTAVDSNSAPLVWFRYSRRLAIVSLGLMMAASAFHSLSKPLTISLDCAVLLQCGQMLLEGQRLYVDIIEINPPMIMYISMIPACLAKISAAHPAPCFIFSIWTLTILTAVLCIRVFDGIVEPSERAYVPPLIVALGLADWMMSPISYFGEREHIAVLLIMPFFLLRCVRQNNGSAAKYVAMSAGILAGIGCCIKPFFLLLPVMAELFWLGRSRDPKSLARVEIYCAMLVGVVYAVHFLFLPANSRQSYFDVLIPLTVQGYQAYNTDFLKVLTLDQVPLVKPLSLTGVLLLALILRKRCSFLMPFVAWTLGGYIVFVFQQKGFHYHSIPMRYGMVMLSVLEAMAVLLLLRTKLVRAQQKEPALDIVTILFGLCALASFVACACVIWKFINESVHNYHLADTLNTPYIAQVLRNSSEGDAIFFFDTGGGYQYPLLVQLRRKPGSRFMDMSPFAMVKYVQTHAKTEERRRAANLLEQQMLTQLAADLETRKTKLVFIPEQDWPLPADFSVFRYLEQQGFIRTALRNYKPISSTCEYRVYKRVSDGSR